ncbi:type VI secretion system Vgr family protein [Aquabacterium sp.]|uniref:type VI secretion system Vgr family protein n=1 Tax=Aquabacterium sp. TaxID=1872578 RepID=UPI003D02B8FB
MRSGDNAGDTPNQLRTQLHSTHHQTWLQMGHLLHQADNHRGSFRGLGFELRTDGWGGLRAARGVMLSTFGLNNGLGQTAEPAGDNAPGMALAKQAQQLSQTFHQAATTHQTVGLATAAGSLQGGQSALNDQAAPAAALTKSLSGMVSTTSLPNAQADAADKLTQGGADKVPHTADPDIALIGKAGIGLTAGQDLHLSSGDTTQIASGQDTHWAVGGQARVQTGQAIGVLAGAIQPGGEAAGTGIQDGMPLAKALFLAQKAYLAYLKAQHGIHPTITSNRAAFQANKLKKRTDSYTDPDERQLIEAWDKPQRLSSETMALFSLMCHPPALNWTNDVTMQDTDVLTTRPITGDPDRWDQIKAKVSVMTS